MVECYGEPRVAILSYWQYQHLLRAKPSTAGRQNYLGTYTQKFLVTARPVNNKKIRTLAENSKVHLIELRYDETRSRLADPDAKMLIQRIKEKLATSR